MLCRLRWDTRIQAYNKRRTEKGLSTEEIIRCLKRLTDLYYLIVHP